MQKTSHHCLSLSPSHQTSLQCLQVNCHRPRVNWQLQVATCSEFLQHYCVATVPRTRCRLLGLALLRVDGWLNLSALVSQSAGKHTPEPQIQRGSHWKEIYAWLDHFIMTWTETKGKFSCQRKACRRFMLDLVALCFCVMTDIISFGELTN